MPTDIKVTHSRAPWTVHPYTNTGAGTVAATPSSPAWSYRDITIGAGDTIVATVHSRTLTPHHGGFPFVTDPEELDANTRLMCAAPDLLAALKDCADVLDNYSDVNDGEDGPVANRAMSMLTEIERVIAKAEGR